MAEEVAGDDQRSKMDIMRPLALLNDLVRDTDEGDLGEALRPMYVDYLLEHDADWDDPTTERELARLPGRVPGARPQDAT